MNRDTTRAPPFHRRHGPLLRYSGESGLSCTGCAPYSNTRRDPMALLHLRLAQAGGFGGLFWSASRWPQGYSNDVAETLLLVCTVHADPPLLFSSTTRSANEWTRNPARSFATQIRRSKDSIIAGVSRFGQIREPCSCRPADFAPSSWTITLKPFGRYATLWLRRFVRPPPVRISSAQAGFAATPRFLSVALDDPKFGLQLIAYP